MSLLADGSGTGSTITIPGSILAGDICVISNFGKSSSGTVADALPSGFTAYQNTASNATTGQVRHCLCYKVLDGTETTVTGINTTEMAWIVVVYRPDIPILTAVTGQAVVGGSSTGNIASVTITAASASTLPALLIGGMTSDGAIDPRSVSPSMNELSVDTRHYFHHLVYNSGPSDHTYDMDDEGGRNIMGCGYLTFTW
jgi:hypothetical protein